MTTLKGIHLNDIDTNNNALLERASVGGTIRMFSETLAVAITDLDTSDIIVLAEIPSSAKVQRIEIYNTDLDTATALVIDIGVYNGTKAFEILGATTAAEALIDVDSYALGVTQLQAASVTGSINFAFEERSIANAESYIWEDAGLTEDPQAALRIAMTLSAGAGTPATGTILSKVYYTNN